MKIRLSLGVLISQNIQEVLSVPNDFPDLQDLISLCLLQVEG